MSLPLCPLLAEICPFSEVSAGMYLECKNKYAILPSTPKSTKIY